MEILREWFLWGESDLFFYGMIIILIAVLFPWRYEKQQKHYLIIILCLITYGISEWVVTCWSKSWLLAFLFLFIGGIALSIAIGRILKFLWSKMIIKR